MTIRLLLVSDDRAGRRICQAIAPLGFDVRRCESGSAAMDLALQSPPDLILVDAAGDPPASLQLCRSVRSVEETCGLTLILLADSPTSEERLAMLEAGADDCWTEAAGSAEFLLRLRAFARRIAASQATQILRYADVELDVDRYKVRRNGALVCLSSMQLKLLRHLMENPTIVFSREQLLNDVWGNSDLDEGAVTACVARLRRALRDAGGPDLIKSVPSAGYSLDAATAVEQAQEADG